MKANKQKGVFIMLRNKLVLIGFTLFFFLFAIPAYSGILDGKAFVGKNGQIGKVGLLPAMTSKQLFFGSIKENTKSLNR